MRGSIIGWAAAALIAGGVLAGGVASAAPATPAGLAMPDDGVSSARYRHHRKWHRRHGRRYGRRGAMMRDSGNAQNPEAPLRQQRQGQTTGGPSR